MQQNGGGPLVVYRLGETEQGDQRQLLRKCLQRFCCESVTDLLNAKDKACRVYPKKGLGGQKVKLGWL